MAQAARVTDMHTCPMANPNSSPHIGGPILPPGGSTVLIGGMPAARMSDMCVCAGPTDTIITGSSTVFIESLPAARMGDTTSHGGIITVGCATVIIGG